MGARNYCYVASARRRARRWDAHGGGKGHTVSARAQLVACVCACVRVCVSISYGRVEIVFFTMCCLWKWSKGEVEQSHCGRIIWKVYACPKRMHSLGINGEEELRGQPANPCLLGKMTVKTELCVWLLGQGMTDNSFLCE